MRGPCRLLCPALAALLLVGAAGCGKGLYPVRGKVTYPDGAPVTRGTVVFEAKDVEKPTTARGAIQPDGRYELGTFTPGDGVPPGKYRVLIAPVFDPTDADKPPAQRSPVLFDPRYADFNTSGLEREVKAESNDIALTVDRPTGARR